LNADAGKFPTPYLEVNQVLLILLENVRMVLGDYFIGMYLYGSLATGDFEPDRGDIDFLIVTGTELPENIISELKTMHKRIYECGMKWAKHLEGAYIPLNVVRKYSPTGPASPMTNQQKFLVAHEGAAWVIISYILYTTGVVITGPPLKSIIDPVSPEELRTAILALLRDVWAPWQHNSDLFHRDEYQSFVVLTMCRALYTLKQGTIVSKQLSAEWAIGNLDKKWTELIKQAEAWRDGDVPGNVGQTQEFMQYVFNKAGL
jgi:hypothetical protein